MNNSIIFLVFVAIVEIIFYIQGEIRSMATLGIVAALFSLIFFLSTYRGRGKLLLTSVLDYWKPPHQRVQAVILGSSEAPNSTVIRVETKDKEIHTNAGNRIGTRNPHSTQTNTSCTIPIINNRD